MLRKLPISVPENQSLRKLLLQKSSDRQWLGNFTHSTFMREPYQSPAFVVESISLDDSPEIILSSLDNSLGHLLDRLLEREKVGQLEGRIVMSLQYYSSVKTSPTDIQTHSVGAVAAIFVPNSY